MYIISLTYKVPLESIDPHLAAHVEFLDTYYEKGIFFMSGRKVPWTGGVILAEASSKDEVLNIIANDPFYIHSCADYEITEFIPAKIKKELEPFMG